MRPFKLIGGPVNPYSSTPYCILISHFKVFVAMKPEKITCQSMCSINGARNDAFAFLVGDARHRICCGLKARAESRNMG